MRDQEAPGTFEPLNRGEPAGIVVRTGSGPEIPPPPLRFVWGTEQPKPRLIPFGRWKALRNAA